ncbi:MAG: hypothetical protein KF773_42900 [Deltaproteobacteria bacterium]|nr:hypothetical protein [Deltaproteobacteria bacterium]MCW5808390.1 hypothetical protein [Deltaproteobacteria bacterium]
MRAFVAIAAVLAAAGCKSGGAGDVDAGAVGCIERNPPEPAHVHTDGMTHAGLECFTCHQPGGAAGIVFEFAGTVFTRDNGPEGGVHIRIRDSLDRIRVEQTDDAGNFYVRAGSGLAFPVFVDVSACPTTERMNAMLTSPSQGNCNMCHDGGVLGRISINP